MADNNVYSTVIVMLKIALPIAAVGLLASLFLFLEDDTSTAQLSFSKADLDALHGELQVNAPELTGRLPNGALVTVRAEAAYPQDVKAQRVRMDGLSADINVPEENWSLKLVSAQASADIENSQFSMDGGITLKTSDGLSVETEAIEADLKAGIFRANGPISAHSPLGQIQAGALQLSVSADSAEPVVEKLRFKNGVKLIYLPDKAR